MYAIFRALGKQFRAEKGKTLRLPLMDAEAGTKVTFDEVLLSSDGETIRAGEGIILDLAPANWDAATYPEPDKLDLTRDAGQQLGFGYGRHQCVGQQLARAELQIVFHTLLRRIPTLRLAVPFDEVPFKHDRLAYGVYELPVSW